MGSRTEKTIFAINDAIMAIDPGRCTERDPKAHLGLNPLFMPIRHELQALKKIDIKNRKLKLRKLLVNDYIEEDKELRQVGLAYTSTKYF
ncbi:hypothetical protein FQA39_LY16680 [Lamprigera yunnana]|nr:hypothetical protein FQA39_LY16680 [Lamprigera yunnana]